MSNMLVDSQAWHAWPLWLNTARAAEKPSSTIGAKANEEAETLADR
jgi:hypothetical protein